MTTLPDHTRIHATAAGAIADLAQAERLVAGLAGRDAPLRAAPA